MDTEDVDKPDLDSVERIAELVEAFYEKLLADPQLAPLFTEVAQIDIREHFPRIRAYWEKLLLADNNYHRHTMNIHRRLHQQRALGKADFEQWLGYFVQTVDEGFVGPKAQRAKRVATTIAANMHQALNGAPQAD